MGFEGRFWGTVSVATLTTAMAANCGGQTSSSGAGTNPGGDIPSDQLPAALARTVCTNISPCCAKAHKPLNVSTCEIVLTQNYKALLLGDAGVSLPNVTNACLDALGTEVGQCQFDGNAMPPQCAPPTDTSGDPPHGKAGAACQGSCDDDPSAGFTSCDTFSGLTTSDGGTATIMTATLPTCYLSDGLYCDFSSGNGVCSPVQVKGGPCGQEAPEACGEGLYCDQFGTLTCQTLRANGAACDADFECTADTCPNGTCGDTTDDSVFLTFACAD
jgi:Dickkopf N-terminal cysteine-rich region